MSENKKKYELRTIEADDLEMITTIIEKIGYEKFQEAFEDESVKKIIASATKINDAVLRSAGIKIMLKISGIVIKNYKNAKNEIYQFLSDLSGMEVESISHMPLPEYVGMIVEVCKKDDFIDSFKLASSFLK